MGRYTIIYQQVWEAKTGVITLILVASDISEF